jgi:single-stranded-DNA-specific exonuclease
MIQKRWTLKSSSPDTEKSLQSALRVHPVICKLLVQRGIDTYDKARKFFRSQPADYYDPFLMKDMDKAVQRIHQAIDAQESILIYGDYDVDGTTAVALVYDYFSTHADHLQFYIPHRFSEGYGVSKRGIEKAIEEKVSLIITLDCGIKSAELIQFAADHGIDTIVCDHHIPGETIPNAIAILNPKQSDCPYPYKELCGCGIGYKLISAYATRYGGDVDRTNNLLDLLATAIAADIVPITDENRSLCIMGLEKANQNPSIPLRALKKISALDKRFTIGDLVFVIAPRVNAAGRMDDARKAVELFLEEDEIKAKEMANLLQEDNNDRRDVDRLITEEALELIPAGCSFHATILYQPHWHKGVVGIVASRLIDFYYRPTIVLTSSNGKVTGSARSVKGFNLYEGLSACAEYLETFGGHYFAAGLTLQEENLQPFITRFNSVVDEKLPIEFRVPEIEIDADLNFSEITDAFVNILLQFAPHGPDNMKPVFRSRGVLNYKGFSAIVKEKHVRFVVYQEGSKTMNGIGFNLADKFALLENKEGFEMIYHLDENEWQGVKSIQLKVLDIR